MRRWKDERRALKEPRNPTCGCTFEPFGIIKRGLNVELCWYFDQKWLEKAHEIVQKKRGDPGSH